MNPLGVGIVVRASYIELLSLTQHGQDMSYIGEFTPIDYIIQDLEISYMMNLWLMEQFVIYA